MTKVLYGKLVADVAYAEVAQHNANLKLATIGFSSPQWQQYVAALQKSAALCGVDINNVVVPEDLSPQDFCSLVSQISATEVDGVLLQQPLPKGYEQACDCVLPQKDVDCLNSVSVAKLYKGQDCLLPATPAAVLRLLDFYNVDLCGKNVVIVGRGNAVGKPLALACLKRNATVTVCHTKTQNLASVCRGADVLISACGVAGLITADFVTENTIVVDVGLSFVDGKTHGDVAEEVLQKAAACSPVPGGVGPVTRAALFLNLLHTSKG